MSLLVGLLTRPSIHWLRAGLCRVLLSNADATILSDNDRQLSMLLCDANVQKILVARLR